MILGPLRRLYAWRRLRSVVSSWQSGVLGSAAFGGPVGKRIQVVAIFPGELEEFFGVEIGGFFSKEGFEAPSDVRTFPGPKAVAAGGEPVEFENIPHEVGLRL